MSGVAGLVFIYVFARLSMYYYLVIDRDAGVLDSLQHSWRTVSSTRSERYPGVLRSFRLILAGLLAFCVGSDLRLPARQPDRGGHLSGHDVTGRRPARRSRGLPGQKKPEAA